MDRESAATLYKVAVVARQFAMTNLKRNNVIWLDSTS